MKLLTVLLLASVAIPPSLDSALPSLARDKQETRKADEAFKEALAAAKESKKKVFLTFGSPG